MRLVVNNNTNGLFDGIVLPDGWKLTEYVPEEAGIREAGNINDLRQRISTHLPEIVHNLDRYIDIVHRDHDIAIQESYISVDESGTFHITILVSDHDYHSPELIAAKLHVHEYLTPVYGDVSIQVRFSIAEEYYRSHNSQRVYKLNYLYRNTYAA